MALGYKHTPESIKKMRETHIGKHPSQETRLKMGNSHKGFKHSQESIKKMSVAKIGKSTSSWALKEDRHPMWKGDGVGMGAVHDWITKWKGQPKFCEVCGTTNAKLFDWSNVDHKYRRILDDYIRMCRRCHILYDIEHNGLLEKRFNHK